MPTRLPSRLTFSLRFPLVDRGWWARHVDTELLRVLGVEARPFELHRFRADNTSDWAACYEPVEHVEANVPAGGAHRHESTTDAVPEGETRAVGDGSQFPAHVILAPFVLEQPRRVGSGDDRLRDLRAWCANRRELDRSSGVETPIGVEWRPLAQRLGWGETPPHLLRWMS